MTGIGLAVVLAFGQAGEVRVPGPFVAAAMQHALRGTVLHLHRNRPERPGGTVQFGPGLGYRRVEFRIPPGVVDLGIGGRVTYEFDNLWMNAFRVSAQPEAFRFEAGFESLGAELKGRHSWLGDLGAPDLHLDQARLTVLVEPIVDAQGRPTYRRARASFTARVSNDALSIRVNGRTYDLLQDLTGYQSRVQSLVEREIQTALDDPARRAEVGEAVRKAVEARLKALGAKPGEMRFEGTTLVVRPPQA